MAISHEIPRGIHEMYEILETRLAQKIGRIMLTWEKPSPGNDHGGLYHLWGCHEPLMAGKLLQIHFKNGNYACGMVAVPTPATIMTEDSDGSKKPINLWVTVGIFFI